jgi:hypothetical protein
VVKRALVMVVIVGSLLATGNAATKRRHRVRHVHHRLSAHMRRLAWHPMFAGSHEMLVRQNLELDQLALPRIANDQELLEREQARELVPVQNTQSLTVASNLVESRRYCKPWTRDFLQDLSEAYYDQFHKPLIATSLVRTAEQQRKLRRHNGNAAPEAGETVSTHLTGVSVDILKSGMTRKEHTWLEQYFLPLKEAGFIDPIEERRQPVFHVVVFNSYSPALEPVIDTHQNGIGPELAPIQPVIPEFRGEQTAGVSN